METLSLKTNAREAIQKYVKNINKLRTGKASANLIKEIKVIAYGELQPLSYVASVSTQDAFNIVIRPFDKSTMKVIKEAIVKASLGINPQDDGQVIRLTFSPLTGDMKKDIIKELKKLTENAKIDIRKVRHDWQTKIKNNQEASENEKLILEEEMQKDIQIFINEIEGLYKDKEANIIAV